MASVAGVNRAVLAKSIGPSLTETNAQDKIKLASSSISYLLGRGRLVAKPDGALYVPGDVR